MREKDIRLLMEVSPDRELLPGMMRGVEVQRTKTVKAGDLLWCRSYPIWDTSTNRIAEATLKKAREKKGTTDAQRSLNARKAQDKLVQLINANFGAGDIFVTCTYGSDRQPQDLTEANRNMRNYLARLRRYCERKGSPAPAYVYVTETMHKKRGTEYHHHMIIKADITREEAEAIWEKAGFGHANTKAIKRMREGLIGLAKYMGKQVCSAASADGYATRHKWCASKGLVIPQPTEADKKISRRRVEQIAQDMERNPMEARAHLEKCYPGYEVLELTVKTSKWVTGAYVEAVMTKKEERSTNGKRDSIPAHRMAEPSPGQPQA